MAGSAKRFGSFLVFEAVQQRQPAQKRFLRRLVP
jgi:hypothetical protein